MKIFLARLATSVLFAWIAFRFRYGRTTVAALPAGDVQHRSATFVQPAARLFDGGKTLVGFCAFMHTGRNGYLQ